MSLLLQQQLMMAAAAASSGDPYWANVVSLLHFDGANGSAVFADEVSGNVWAANAATITTTAARFGQSGNFSIANSYIDLASFPGYGVGDFTHEFFVYLVRPVSTFNFLFDTRPSQTSGAYPGIYIDSSGTINFFYQNITRITSAPITQGVWRYVALVRRSGVFALYIDGVSAGTYTDASALVASRLRYGCSGYSLTDGSPQCSVYLDEARVTIGVARYSGNFTPPTAPFPNHA